MKFTPLTKEDWIKTVKKSKEFRHLSEEGLSKIYDAMVEDLKATEAEIDKLNKAWDDD